jgi:hypothetical protein
VSQRLRLGLGSALALAAACGPSDERGPVHRVYLEDPDPVQSGNAGNGGEAGAPEPPEPPEPPMPPAVTALKPPSGPYGTEVRIDGTGLGSAARPGVSLQLGAGELTPSSKPEVLSWSETQIRFRYPFPYEGRILVKTPQGEVDVGEFVPTWVPGAPFKSLSGVTSTASLASAPGVLAALLDTGPPSLVVFDGSSWTSTKVPGSNLRADSIRLYLDGDVLSAFGLSSATAPEILGLDPAAGFAQTPSGVRLTSDYRVAGGQDGASVWARTGDTWKRARPSGGAWAVDKGPITDPNPSGAHHAAGTTSDGTLFIGWGEDNGTTFDDRGSAFHQRLPADASVFDAKVKSGGDVDDAVSAVTLFDRGQGLLLRYCGTDKDPFGVTGNDTLCYTALLPAGTKMTVSEDASRRYAFGPNGEAVAFCSESQGLRLAPLLGTGDADRAKLDALAADVVAWPCPNIVAIEVDADGEPLLMLELAGKLYSPRARVR